MSSTPFVSSPSYAFVELKATKRPSSDIPGKLMLPRAPSTTTGAAFETGLHRTRPFEVETRTYLPPADTPEYPQGNCASGNLASWSVARFSASTCGWKGGKGSMVWNAANCPSDET